MQKMFWYEILLIFLVVMLFIYVIFICNDMYNIYVTHILHHIYYAKQSKLPQPATGACTSLHCLLFMQEDCNVELGDVWGREPTVPRPIGEERRLNPFMRVRDPEFAQITELRLAKLEVRLARTLSRPIPR